MLEEHNASDDSLLAHYTYADRLLSLDAGSGKQYYHHDALGSTVNLTDSDGNTLVSYTLDPWSRIRSQTGSSVNRQVFTGQEHDENTGLINFGVRYYDPDLERFLTQDEYLGDNTIQPSLHRYLYAYSNPTVYIDLYGYSALEPFIYSAEDRIHEVDSVQEQIAKEKAVDFLNDQLYTGWKYNAEAALYGIYKIGLQGARSAIDAADFLIDVGTLNEFNENSEAGRRALDRIIAVDKELRNARNTLKNLYHILEEDPASAFREVAKITKENAPKLVEKINEKIDKVYIQGDTKEIGNTASFLASLVEPGKKAKAAMEATEAVNKAVKKRASRKTSKSGETIATETGKSIHKAQADIRRDMGEFNLVQSAIKDQAGNPILVSKRIDLKTGLPKSGSPLQEAIPDAASFKSSLILDDKPLGRPLAKDRQEIIRFIRAYEIREGVLPNSIAIQRYNPKTGTPVHTELFSPSDFLPK